MLLDMNCKGHFLLKWRCCFSCLPGPTETTRLTEGGHRRLFRQVLEALKNLAGFQVRKPKLDLKNTS